MVEIPHGVAFEERRRELQRKKSRPSRFSRFLFSITNGKFTDPKPVVLGFLLIVIVSLIFYLAQIFANIKNNNRLVPPEGYKIIYSKDSPPRLEKIQ